MKESKTYVSAASSIAIACSGVTTFKLFNVETFPGLRLRRFFDVHIHRSQVVKRYYSQKRRPTGEGLQQGVCPCASASTSRSFRSEVSHRELEIHSILLTFGVQ